MSNVTNDPTPIAVEWLGAWDRHTERAQRIAYMQQELERVEALGIPPLYAVLSAPLQDQQDLGTLVLRQRSYVPMLRLRKGFTPWPKDPDGRDLPANKRGKVHVVKVGVRGQMGTADLQARNDETARYTGPARMALARSPGGLYHTTELSHAPKPMQLDDAIVVMRAWGVGLATKRWAKAKSAAPMDRWAVEEVPTVEPEAPAEAPSAPAGKRAAA